MISCLDCDKGKWVPFGEGKTLDCSDYPCWKPKHTSCTSLPMCDTCWKRESKYMFRCGEATSFHCELCAKKLIRKTPKEDKHRWEVL